MTKREVTQWIADYGTLDTKRFCCNGMPWFLVKRKDDGWVAVFEEIGCDEYLPKIEAADFAKAEDYCKMHERINVPINIL